MADGERVTSSARISEEPEGLPQYEYLPAGASQLSVRVEGRRVVDPEGQTILPSVFRFIAPKSKSVVLYSVAVTQMTPTRRDWVVERRYRDFEYLNNKLQKFVSLDATRPLPGKQLFSTFSDPGDESMDLFLQKREKALHKWTQNLVDILQTKCSQKLRYTIRKFLLPTALAVALTKTKRQPEDSRKTFGAAVKNVFFEPIGSDKMLGIEKSPKRRAKQPRRSMESKILSLVMCGDFIAEGTVKCKEPFLLRIKNPNDLCVIIFSDGCYCRFRCRLLLRRLDKRGMTSFPISHKGDSVGDCYIKRNTPPLSLSNTSRSILSITPTTFLTICVGVSSYTGYWDPSKNYWEMAGVCLLAIYLTLHFRDDSIHVSISDTPFPYDEEDGCEEENEEFDELNLVPFISLGNEKKLELKTLAQKMHEKLMFFVKEPPSVWRNVRTPSSGIRVAVYEGSGWDEPTLLVCCSFFIPNVAVADVHSLLNCKELSGRLIFDKNAAGLKTVAHVNDDASIVVDYSWQKDYFGGLIASREFLNLASYRFTELSLDHFPRTEDLDEKTDDGAEDEIGKVVKTLVSFTKWIELPEFLHRKERTRAKIMLGGSIFVPVNNGVRIKQYASLEVGGWVPNSVTSNGLFDATVDIATHIKGHFKSNRC